MSITELVTDLGHALKKRQWKLVSAESCTGGGLAYSVTSIPGSSEWFDRGFVTYSNMSKQEMLGVSGLALESFGAVSEQVAFAMVEGALAQSGAEVGVAITGIAGPDGGSVEKPVGTVWFAWKGPLWETVTQVHYLTGSRTEIREQAIGIALEELLSRVLT